jgi:mRNA interferase MazF
MPSIKINRGDIFWIPLFDDYGVQNPIVHPNVVIQDTVINQSRIDVIVVCGISTNMKRAFEPGNILLDPGEGDLPKQSIVVVSQISVVKKLHIGEYIGLLSERRIEQIFAGMRYVQSFTEGRS